MSKRKRVNDMKYHYTYRITNIKEEMYYYGVHSCDCLPKEDIGIQYWSSSKIDGFVKHQKQNPEQYKYKVIKIFSTRVEAVEHEMFLHSKFDVKLHKKFYNDSNQTSTGFDTTGKGNFIDENGNKIFMSCEEAKIRGLTGVPKSDECKAKLAVLYEGKTLEEIHGIEKANEIKTKISTSQIGISRITPEGRKQLSLKKKGIDCFTVEQKLIMSKERSNKIHVKNILTRERYRLDNIEEFKHNPLLVGSMLKFGHEILLNDIKIIIFKYEHVKEFTKTLNVGDDIIRKLLNTDKPYNFTDSGIKQQNRKYYENIHGLKVNKIHLETITIEYLKENIEFIYNPYDYNFL